MGEVAGQAMTGRMFQRLGNGIVTLTWIGREKTSEGRKSAFHAALRTHVSCFQTSNALVR